MRRRLALLLILSGLMTFSFAGDECKHKEGKKAEKCCANSKKCKAELEECKKKCKGDEECIKKCEEECRKKCKKECKMKDKKAGPDEASLKEQGKPQAMCPVMDSPIKKTSYVDVEGKRIYVCCDGCKGAIKKDPAKFIKKLEDDGITLELVSN